MKKIVLSGSHGFIGSATGTYFLNKGYQVLTLPRDMLDERWELQRFFEETRPDYILHFSAYGNHSFQRDIDETIKANIQHLIHLLNASKTVDYSLFVNISSSSVQLPKKTYYSITKQLGQDLCEVFSKENNKPIVSIQPCSVYGEGEAPFRFIPTVIQSALQDKYFDLVEEPSHDWIYIDDFVRGVETVMEKKKQGVIAIGTGTQYTNKEIVEKIEMIHQRKVCYNPIENLRSYDTDNWEINVDEIYHLGWKPQVDLYKGLSNIYKKYDTSMA